MDPFLQNTPYELKKWNLSERIELLLGQNKWWFRSSGNSDFLELIKSFWGIIKIVEYLNINLNWYKLFLEVAPHLDLEKIEHALAIYNYEIPQLDQLAKYLIIKVYKDNIEHVKLELPAITFLDIENLIPPDVKTKLNERALDIVYIKIEYLKKGLIPGEVFSLVDQNSSFHIYLV